MTYFSEIFEKNIFWWILFEYSNNVHVTYKFVDIVVFIYLIKNILLRALFAYSNNILKKIIISQKLFQYVDNIHVKIKFVDNNFWIFN